MRITNMNKMQCVVGTIVLSVLGLHLVSAQNTMSFFITSKGTGDGANLGGLAGADKHC